MWSEAQICHRVTHEYLTVLSYQYHKGSQAGARTAPFIHHSRQSQLMMCSIQSKPQPRATETLLGETQTVAETITCLGGGNWIPVSVMQPSK